MSSRREFLKFIGVGVGAAVAAPLLASPAVPVVNGSFNRTAATALGGEATKTRKIKQSGLYGTFRNPHLVTKLDVGLSD